MTLDRCRPAACSIDPISYFINSYLRGRESWEDLSGFNLYRICLGVLCYQGRGGGGLRGQGEEALEELYKHGCNSQCK